MFTPKNLMHLLYYGHTQYCLPRLSRPQLMLPFVVWNSATVEPRQSHSCYGCAHLPATIQLPLMETFTQESREAMDFYPRKLVSKWQSGTGSSCTNQFPPNEKAGNAHPGNGHLQQRTAAVYPQLTPHLSIAQPGCWEHPRMMPRKMGIPRPRHILVPSYYS